MTSRDVMKSVVGRASWHLWDPLRQLIAPNTNGVVGWEADILVVHKTGYVDEIEVKISVADFRREFSKKSHKHKVLQCGRPSKVRNPNYAWRNGQPFHLQDWDNCKPHPVRRFWFALPEEIHAKIESEIPSYAGVIVVRETGDKYRPLRALRLKEAPVLKNSRKIEAGEREALLLSCYHRAWPHLLGCEEGAA